MTHLIHGHERRGKRSGAYQSWMCMIQRCTNPKHKAFKDYGAKGINVCDSWRTFVNFLADMGDRPEGMTIERKNNWVGYEPGNCRWATRAEQSKNKGHGAADLTGSTFGYLTAMAMAPEIAGRKWHAHWHCRCICGADIVVSADNLKNSPKASCGCLTGKMRWWQRRAKEARMACADK